MRGRSRRNSPDPATAPSGDGVAQLAMAARRPSGDEMGGGGEGRARRAATGSAAAAAARSSSSPSPGSSDGQRDGVSGIRRASPPVISQKCVFSGQRDGVSEIPFLRDLFAGVARFLWAAGWDIRDQTGVAPRRRHPENRLLFWVSITEIEKYLRRKIE